MHGTFKTNVKPNRKDITSILSAGGATLLSSQEAVAQGADLAIVPDGTGKNVRPFSLTSFDVPFCFIIIAFCDSLRANFD